MQYYKLTNVTVTYNAILLSSNSNGNTCRNPNIDAEVYEKCRSLLNPFKWKELFDIPYTLYREKPHSSVLIDSSLLNQINTRMHKLLPLSKEIVLLARNVSETPTFSITSMDDIEEYTKFIGIKAPSPKDNPTEISQTVNMLKFCHKQLDLVEKLLKKGTLLSIDIEAYERNQLKLLEIGITTVVDGVITSNHYIVQETMKYRNGTFVADNRDNFVFGTSQILSLSQIEAILHNHIQNCDIVVGQSVHNDFNFLKTNNIRLMKRPVVDTASFSIIYNSLRPISLYKLCTEAGIDTAFMHNAGNDSRYCIDLLINLVQSRLLNRE